MTNTTNFDLITIMATIAFFIFMYKEYRQYKAEKTAKTVAAWMTGLYVVAGTIGIFVDQKKSNVQKLENAEQVIKDAEEKYKAILDDSEATTNRTVSKLQEQLERKEALIKKYQKERDDFNKS